MCLGTFSRFGKKGYVTLSKLNLYKVLNIFLIVNTEIIKHLKFLICVKFFLLSIEEKITQS